MYKNNYNDTRIAANKCIEIAEMLVIYSSAPATDAQEEEEFAGYAKWINKQRRKCLVDVKGIIITCTVVVVIIINTVIVCYCSIIV